MGLIGEKTLNQKSHDTAPLSEVNHHLAKQDNFFKSYLIKATENLTNLPCGHILYHRFIL
jgi:hypothetical protein